MHLNIQGRHLIITPAINSYVKSKIKKTHEHFDGIINSHVVLATEKNQHIAEVTITAEHHHFHNKVKSDSLYKSIDFLFDKIERQVRRYKEYQTDKYHKQEKLNFHLQEVEEMKSDAKVEIIDRAISTKPMNDLEAVLQLSIATDRAILGYMTGFNAPKPSYLEKITDSEFSLISFDEYWEMKHVQLVNQNRLEITKVESLRPSLASLENVVEFLIENDETYRFFISVRTHKSMFLHKIQKDKFSLIREQL